MVKFSKVYFSLTSLVVIINPHNKINITELNSVLRSHFTTKWQKKWEETDSPLKYIQKRVSDTYQCVLRSRSSESVLHCLRTGNIGLNEDLKKWNQHDTGLCSNCGRPETVLHFLMECPIYLIERTMMLVETNFTQISDILILLKSSNPVHQKALVDFVTRTQRL